jgi:quercetin dioxygenase-like cupin family protein
MHTHPHQHLILYLTEGAPLILPELKMTIMPKRGAYYIFPANILHGVAKIEEETKTRYCLVTNIIEGTDWKKNKLIKEATDARDKELS